jgi:hypothetical protein
MGTEIDPDVEGQTEPPICGFKSAADNSHSPTLAGTPQTGTDTDADADADATDATVGRGSIISTTTDTARVLTPESAHTLSVPDVCALLETDLE